ncbi:hypothetical protein, partial [Solicola sp. PLA-1-18]|uniref:hypothetical protein n=1 Tax=Solicola sp. PLA-1-18 TaxID=3380532 RepID=UPI003B7D2C56
AGAVGGEVIKGKAPVFDNEPGAVLVGVECHLHLAVGLARRRGGENELVRGSQRRMCNVPSHPLA